jgi:Transposase DDE domain group 1
VKVKIRRQLNRRKRRIERRLNKFNVEGCEQPMFTASNIHYEISERDRGIAHGGIGAMHALANRFGLAEAIDRRLVLFKFHLPYHESDHVLNIAYNALCGGTCLEDIELRRNDEAFLDALGARRIPDPTTAGDFCRRFRGSADIHSLQDAFHAVRLKVWAQQPPAFFERAIIDMDGTLVGTTGSCKQGMDISYKGTWGYHPLVVSLANTGEVLSIVNRPGNRPSHEGAAAEIERCMAICFKGGFRKILLRGDNDFSQTKHLDRWHANPNIKFIFGFDSRLNLKERAENLPPREWQKLERPPRYEVATKERQRPENVKDRLVKQRQFDTLRLNSEEVAEFNYTPTECKVEYRMVVIRKNITKEKGELRLHDEIRYFFYITNDWAPDRHEIVFCANDRCNQENLHAQLHSGCRALAAPVDSLESNWAYMVMAALAWDLKAWFALALPEGVGRHQEKYRSDKRWLLGLEFKTFVQAFVRMPCQIVRTGRRIVYRLLSWNPYQAIFFRLLDALRC